MCRTLFACVPTTLHGRRLLALGSEKSDVVMGLGCYTLAPILVTMETLWSVCESP